MWKIIKNDKQNYSKSWDFSKEPNLDGIYVESKKAKSKSGKPITFHIFKVGEENVSVLGGTVLDRNVDGIEKGQRVMIAFNGEKTSKAGNSYRDYSFSIWED